MSDYEDEIRYYDRESGEMRSERVFGGDALRRLYRTRSGRFLTDRLLTRGPLNHLYGWLKRAPWSAREIVAFADGLGIDVEEAERPVGGYRSLDEFFTRRLRAGARPIDPDPEALLSPGDGRLLVFPAPVGLLPIKGTRLSIAELVADREQAARYAEGDVAVLRLAPADYHRFHFPAAGRAHAPRAVAGRLHSVHPIALTAGAPSFANKRVVTALVTPLFGTLQLVEVGALLVGTIVQTFRPGEVERGAEKGYFRFGGSTVVVLTPPGVLRFDDDLVERSRLGIETFVKVGTRIGRRRG